MASYFGDTTFQSANHFFVSFETEMASYFGDTTFQSANHFFVSFETEMASYFGDTTFQSAKHLLHQLCNWKQGGSSAIKLSNQQSTFSSALALKDCDISYKLSKQLITFSSALRLNVAITFKMYNLF